MRLSIARPAEGITVIDSSEDSIGSVCDPWETLRINGNIASSTINLVPGVASSGVLVDVVILRSSVKSTVSTDAHILDLD